MRDSLKRLGAESVVYGLGQVSGRAVQLLLVPILTRALAPEAFGVAELVIGYSQTVILLLVMGMDGALARFFYEQPDTEARIRMASSSLVFRIVTGTGAALALALFAAPLAEHLISGAAYRKYFLIGAATLPFTLLVMFGNDILRVTFQPWKFVTLNFVQTVLVAGLSIWFVVVRGEGVVGVLYGRLIGDAVAAALGLVLARHSIAPRFSRTILRTMLRYGLPSVPAAFGFGLLAGLDRYFMQRWRPLDEVAVYAVALKIFAVVTMAASAFQLAYGPFAFARAKTEEAPRLYARVFMGYIAVGCLGALAVSAFTPEALAWLVPAEYAGAALPALWLAFAAVGLGAYTVASLGIGLSLRTPLLAWCSGSGAVAGVVAHLLLTPRLGAPGAALATLVGYAVTAVVTYAIAQRVHPLPLRGGRALALCGLALALAVPAQTLAPAGWAGVGWKLAAIAAFAATAWALKVHRNAGAIAPGWAASATERGAS